MHREFQKEGGEEGEREQLVGRENESFPLQPSLLPLLTGTIIVAMLNSA